jgi:hypothetical protein
VDERAGCVGVLVTGWEAVSQDCKFHLKLFYSVDSEIRVSTFIVC